MNSKEDIFKLLDKISKETIFDSMIRIDDYKSNIEINNLDISTIPYFFEYLKLNNGWHIIGSIIKILSVHKINIDDLIVTEENQGKYDKVVTHYLDWAKRKGYLI